MTPRRFSSLLATVLLAGPLAAQPAPEGSALAAARQAQAAGRYQEAFLLLLQALAALPEPAPLAEELRLRENLVRLASVLEPPPVVPEPATRLLTRGLVLFKDARDRAGLVEARQELARAVRAAPWHLAATYNLGLVQEKLQEYEAAAGNLRLYLLASVDPERSSAVQAKVYELELRAEQSRARRRELASARPGEGGRLLDVGAWWTYLARSEEAALGVASGCRPGRVFWVAAWPETGDHGLRARDVILGVDGACGVDGFEEALRRGTAGGTATLAVLRDGQKLERRAGVVDTLPLLRRGCEAGEAAACLGLATWYSGAPGRSGDPGRPADPARAAALLEVACDAGEPRACAHLSDVVLAGWGVTRDAARAALLARQACDAGEAGACHSLAIAHERGLGVATDQAEAARLLEVACRGGDGTACRVGTWYVRGDRGVVPDPARGRDLCRRGEDLLLPHCEAGSGRACVTLVGMVEHGCLPRDEPRIPALYERACEGGDGTGCNGAGNIARKGGYGRKRDPAAAVRHYERGCELLNALACRGLAIHLAEGEGVKRDRDRAAKLYAEACRLGDQESCTRATQPGVKR